MATVAIRAHQLSKRFHLGGGAQAYRTLDRAVSQATVAAFRTLTGRRSGTLPASTESNMLWALRDVSFELRDGESVGIVGHNGAGKTTLLKILGRILEPTSGWADVRGRVGTLLEVGTGFHPELTGRENIYLNGTLLGMRRREIDRRLEQIVEFAAILGFVDVPMKRYSSGMWARLAFAVAVHLQSEILVVDEVLSVGDAEFQRKSLAKMKEIGGTGRTVLFVSHNLSAVRSVCSRALVLEHGRLTDDGPVDATLDRYLGRLDVDGATSRCADTRSFVVEDVRIAPGVGVVVKTFESATICVAVRAKRPIRDPGLYVGILARDGYRLTGLDFKDFRTIDPLAVGERVELGFRIESLPLLPGSYEVELHLKDSSDHVLERVPRTFPFEVVETAVYRGRKIETSHGVIGMRVQAIADRPMSAPETRQCAIPG